MIKSIPAIDSVNIQIPLDRVRVKSDFLGELVSDLAKSTGAISEEATLRNKIPIQNNGINTEFSIATMFKGMKNSGESERVLRIKLTAKTAKEHYFLGITKATLPKIYAYLISLDVVDFSYNSLLKSWWVDFDIKVDYQEPNKLGADAVRDTIQKLTYYVNPTYRKNTETHREGYSYFNKPNNNGLQFFDRKKSIGRGSDPYKNQFSKFYNKTLMLRADKNSALFAETYLQGQNIENILRYETSIKGRVLRDYYNLPTTLEGILDLEEETLWEMVRKPLVSHLCFDELEKIPKEVKKTISVQKRSHYMLIADKLNSLMRGEIGVGGKYFVGLPFNEAVESLVNEVIPINGSEPLTSNERTERKRLRKLYEDAWREFNPIKKEISPNAQLTAFPTLSNTLNLNLRYKP